MASHLPYSIGCMPVTKASPDSGGGQWDAATGESGSELRDWQSHIAGEHVEWEPWSWPSLESTVRHTVTM